MTIAAQAVAVVGTLAYLIFVPKEYHHPSLLIILGGFACVVGYFTIQTFVFYFRLNRTVRQNAATPTLCPKCGQSDHEFKCGGLWDGIRDPVTGARTFGSYTYGVCKSCRTQWGQQNDEPPYVVDEIEWEREVAGPEREREIEINTPIRDLRG